MRTLILRFGPNEAHESSPGTRLVQLVPGTPGTNQITWQPASEVPVDEILLGEVFQTIRDETGLAPLERRALFLALFPALDFGGEYVFVLSPGKDEPDPALAALAQALARGTQNYSRAGIVHGQTDRAYAENTTAAVTFRGGEVAVTKFKGEGRPLRIMRAVSWHDFPGEWEEVVPAEPYSRSPPMVVDNPEWLAQRLAQAMAEACQTTRAGLLGVLRNITIVGDGAVHDGRLRILAESLQNIAQERVIPHFYRLSNHSFASLGWWDEEEELDLPNLVMLKQAYDGNYGHWVMETLPRMGMVAERFSPADCHVMVMGWYAPMVPVHADSLRWCGVLPEKILVSRNSPIHAKRVIFPTPICDPPWVFAPFAIRFLERLAARVQAAHPDMAAAAGERLYLSRNRFGRRVLRNEEEVTAFLAARGYRVFYPDTLSFTDQVLALSRATHVVANMGAALTNAVFAPRGVRVLALATENMPDDFFWDITAQKGGSYFSLHGRATEPEKGMQADFSIGLDRLREVFALFDPG